MEEILDDILMVFIISQEQSTSSDRLSIIEDIKSRIAARTKNRPTQFRLVEGFTSPDQGPNEKPSS